MSSLSDITGYLTRWIDSVAALVVNTLSSLGTRKRVQVIEEEDGSFVFQSGTSPTPSGLPFERALIADLITPPTQPVHPWMQQPSMSNRRPFGNVTRTTCLTRFYGS